MVVVNIVKGKTNLNTKQAWTKQNAAFAVGGLIWDSSTNRTDDEDATIDFYHCPKCGYSYEVYSPTAEGQEDYKEFWNDEK